MNAARLMAGSVAVAVAALLVAYAGGSQREASGAMGLSFTGNKAIAKPALPVTKPIKLPDFKKLDFKSPILPTPQFESSDSLIGGVD